MARIVIDIPDYMLNQIMIGCPFKLPSQFVTETYEIIRNGKILPKGHGRLIDANEVGKYVIIGNAYLRKCPTIIEADKEEE